MRRKDVLQLALQKHGNSFKAINDAFLKRREATRMRRDKIASKRAQKERVKQNKKKELDAMLAAEGIPAEGYYYNDCVNGDLEIDMYEFRFRHYIATTGSREYEGIINLLLKENDRHFYRGIHADAREVFHARLVARGVSFECV